MRGLLVVIAVVVVLLIVAVATGFINIGQTQTAELPEVQVQGGQMPEYDAQVGDIDVKTEQKTVEVPTLDFETADEEAAEPAR